MTNLVFRRPSQELDHVWDSLFNDFFNSVSRTPFVKQAQKSNYPRIDIRDARETTYIDATVPGLSKEDISIKYDDGLLTISADKQSPEGSTEFLHREIHRSSFSRSFSVDNSVYDVKSISADIVQGILTISIPKLEDQLPPEPRSIPIG